MDELPEVSPLPPRPGAAPARLRPLARLRALLRARPARLILGGLILGGLAAYLFAQVLPVAPPRMSVAPTPTTVAIRPRLPAPTIDPRSPTPAPAAGALPPPPVDCPASPALDSITAQAGGFTKPVRMYGRAPVWVPTSYLPEGTRYVNEPSTPVPYPGLKVIWEVGPDRYPTVMARVSDLRTGEPAWWMGSGGTPDTPVLTLDSNGFTSSGAVGPVFLEWPTFFTVPHAGCYRLDVSWDGGGWSTIFAAGGGSGA